MEQGAKRLIGEEAKQANTADGQTMKVTGDYRAKIRLWAMAPRVAQWRLGPALPGFAAQKFKTHAEMNRWKESLIRAVARRGTNHG